MTIRWTEDLSVGNDVIDSDHRLLMELVNDVARAAGTGGRLALSRAIRRFRNCINLHFVTEEMFAHMLNLPFDLHKMAHQNMRTELELMEIGLLRDGMETAHASVMEHYAGFLRDWLVRHITEEDMQMKPALQSHPYDLKIDGAGSWLNINRLNGDC